MPETSQAARSLKRLRQRAGLSVCQMSAALGFESGSAYQHYEDRYKKKFLPAELVHELVDILVPRGIPRDDVHKLGGLTPPNVTANDNAALNVGLISWVRAGSLMEAADPYVPGGAEEIITVDYHRTSLIALRVHGNSMNRVAPDGSIIVVDYEDRTPIEGRFYVFKVGEETTFKRFRAAPLRLEPDSLEPGHDPIFPESNLQIVGRVVRVVTSL